MRLWAVFGLGALALHMATAFAAQAPSISAAPIRDFTRLSFGWETPTRFQVEPFNGGVTLVFNEATDISAASLQAPLGDLVRNVTRSADGKRVTLTFKQPYRVRNFVSGNANGIDILGTQPAPPVAEAPKAEPAEEAKKPEVPAPQAKPTPPAPNLQTQPLPESAVLPEPAVAPPTPEQPKPIVAAQAPVAEIKPEKPVPEVAAAAAAIETPKPSEPVATVAPAAPAPAEAAADVPTPAATTPAATADQPTEQPTATPATPAAPAPQPELAATEPTPAKASTPPAPEPISEKAPEVKTETAPIEQAAPAAETSAEPPAAPATPEAAAPVAPAPAPTPSAPEPTGTNPQQSMPLSAVNTATEGTIAPPDPSRTEAEPAPDSLIQPPSAQQAETDSGDGSFLITTYSLPTGVEIRFPWVRRVAAAVFMRQDVLWIVFNDAKKIDINRLQSILPASILSVDQVPLAGHTVLRLQTDGSVYPKVMQPKNSGQWWVVLSMYQQIPAQPISLERRTEGTRKPHLHVPSLQTSAPINIIDPMVGDELMVVPYFTSGEGVYPARQFAELDLLASAQGLAAVKKDDFAEIKALRNGFRLTARDGLHLSDKLPELALTELESLNESITWYPYESWRVEQGQFFDTRRALEAQLQNAADVRANSLRLKLAQLYLGEGLANEALAWLDIIEQKDPFFFKDRKLIALRAAAQFLKDDYAGAKASFMDEALADYPERKLWLEALTIFEQDRPRFDYIDYFQTYISKYPPALREKLAIIAADNYINRKSFSRAIKTLDSLSLTGVQSGAMPYVTFLLGKVAAENGNLAGARELWEPLIADDGDRFVRATAQFALTTMLYNSGEIPRSEAIARLDRLRVVWRGDALELALLNYVGQLYSDDKRYLEALRAWQDVVQNFPESQIAIDVAKKMAETFDYLYSKGGADAMPPLQALAAFYEFRQLTPIGEAGDVMIQALADRLIGVDLLDRAAGLLEHQIKFRQEKLARSQLAAKLALVYILNQNPQRALDVLQLSGFGQMPEDLTLYRKRLSALALMNLGQSERALTMLENDPSREADAIRLQLNWQMRNWPEAIVMGERLLGARSDVTAPLTSEETEQLLQLSIAYMFERNRNQLNYLREYFDPLVPDGPKKEIFRFVTNPGEEVDPQQFTKMAGQIANLESFMSNYRKQLEQVGGLSPIVN